jgi:hypothetical protein
MRCVVGVPSRARTVSTELTRERLAADGLRR